MDDWLTDPIGIIVVLIGFIMIILIVWLLALNNKLKKLRKRYMAALGESGVHNMEDAMINVNEVLVKQQKELTAMQASLAKLEQSIPLMKSRTGVRRYNAFGEQGNDLSFSIAIVNEQNDGVVLSGIHNRENMFVYAKPLEKGASKYPLTPEEKEAIAGSK